MAEVRVKIGADIRDLQKGVRDAQKEVGSLSDTAKRASGSLGGTARSIEQIKQEARDAIKESQKFRQSLEDAGQTASVFGSTFKAIFAAEAVQKVVGLIKDKLVEALTEGTRAAEEMRKKSKQLYDQLSDFSELAGKVRVFENREQIIAEGQRIDQAINQVNDRLKQLGAEGRTVFGFNLEPVQEGLRKIAALSNPIVKSQNLIIENDRKRLADLLGQKDSLTEQLDELDRAARLDKDREGSNLNTREQLEKQADALKEQIKAAKELQAIRAAIFAVEGPSPVGSRGVAEDRARRISSGVPDRPANPAQLARDAGFEQAAKEAADYAFALRDLSRVIDAGLIDSSEALNQQIDLTRSRLVQLAQQGLVNTDTFRQLKAEYDSLILQQAGLSEQAALGGDVFTQFGVDATAALADIALGFEKLQDLGSILQDIVKQLVRDIALAAAKAAILTVFFPGASQAAGGFKALFKQGLGLDIPALASGGIVSKPTLSLIGEAGPEAVVPLSKLSSMAGDSVKVEPFSVTVRGGDLVLAFQQARQQTARSVGNIPLR